GGERRGVENDPSDLLAPGDQAAGDPKACLELQAGAAEHLLVLDLLLREAQQRPEPGLVAIHLGASAVHHQRDDVLLDKREDVAIAVAADLVEHALLVLIEAADVVDARDPLGEKPLAEVEVPAAEAVVHRPGP